MMRVEQVQPQPDIKVESYGNQQNSLLGNARNGFIRKVYSILTLQLVITFLFVVPSLTSQDYVNFQSDNMWLFFTAIGLSLAFLVPLACSVSLSQLFPINFVFLFGFTVCEAYMVSVFCTIYTPESVMQAAVATCAATLGLTFYAMNTKDDFTECGHFLAGWFWSLVFVSIAVVVMNLVFTRSDFLTALLAIGIAAIYSLYLVIDTQLVIQREGTGLTLDNYVLGAVLLYLDIIRLFIQILKVIGKRKK